MIGAGGRRMLLYGSKGDFRASVVCQKPYSTAAHKACDQYFALLPRMEKCGHMLEPRACSPAEKQQRSDELSAVVQQVLELHAADRVVLREKEMIETLGWLALAVVVVAAAAVAVTWLVLRRRALSAGVEHVVVKGAAGALRQQRKARRYAQGLAARIRAAADDS